MIKHEEILDALKARSTWEDRQATFYQMRHDGLRRRNKPWPNAADLHYPLVDTLIEKQKPGYVAQVFSTDTVATFTALKQDWQPYQSGAAQWFDYQLKQESNFEDEVVVAADRMLQSGKAIVKVYWDPEEQQLTFEAINPLYVIVPAYTGRLKKADWVVHVQHYSKHAYRRLAAANFDVSEQTLAEISGEAAEGGTSASQLEQVRAQREGLTKPHKGGIVVWELFYRAPDGTIRVRTYSPSAPERELRPEFGLPYNKGLFAKNQQPLPFFELNAEIKDRGFFDSRGVAERVAPFEAKLCKDWNTHSDSGTLLNQPMFYASNGVPSGANIRMVPGQILPFQLQAVTMPPPPMDLMQSMLGTRQTAQELVGVIDYGTPSQAAPKDRKTATETNLIGNVMAQGTDLRTRIFRRELSYGLALAHGILLQYRAQALDYFFLDELQQLPPEALNGDYRIELSGSGDNNNRAFVMQKAVARMNMLRGAPSINQDELVKTVLEADDPRLVKRLFVNAGTQAAVQMEDQAQEISIMLLGFPAEVRPGDDDVAHLKSVFGFLERRMAKAEPIGPEMVLLFAQHAQQHAAAAAKKQPEAWKQAQAMFAQPMAMLGQAAQAAQQQLAQQQAMQQAAAAQAAPAAMAPAPVAQAPQRPAPGRMAA